MIILVNNKIIGAFVCPGKKGIKGRSRVIYRTLVDGCWKLRDVSASGPTINNRVVPFTFLESSGTNINWIWSDLQKTSAWEIFCKNCVLQHSAWNLSSDGKTTPDKPHPPNSSPATGRRRSDRQSQTLNKLQPAERPAPATKTKAPKATPKAKAPNF